MQVEILTITEAAGEDVRVEVASGLGRFVGRWQGTPPRPGDRRAVELGFDDVFTWGVDAVQVERCAPVIEAGEAGGVVLRAVIEELDEDGYVGVRLGPSILMLEAHGETPPVGAMVQLAAPVVTLYDMDI